MARYIDADALLKSMQRRYDEICDTYGYHDLYASGYDDAVDAVENAPTADVEPRAEWISVEERIPKNFESVLVLATRLEDDEYDVLVAYHDRGDWEEQHTRRYESPICGEIKYWMPLPEPPKENTP